MVECNDGEFDRINKLFDIFINLEDHEKTPKNFQALLLQLMKIKTTRIFIFLSNHRSLCKLAVAYSPITLAIYSIQLNL
jgi:hypothetical protein